MRTPFTLTDLHCHLLPGIDDGARDEENALLLLKQAYNSGIRRIALTSHFNCENDSLEDFLERRDQAYMRLCLAMEHDSCPFTDLEMKLGSEVYFSPNLCSIDVKKLCLDRTNILLMELPTEHKPAYFEEVVNRLQLMGIRVMIAHVERYSYVMDNLPILCDWADQDILMHVNASTLIRKDRFSSLCMNMLKWNLVHFITSDAHSVHRRPVNLLEGMNRIEEVLGKEMLLTIIENTEKIFHGEDPEIEEMHCPKKVFGRWW